MDTGVIAALVTAAGAFAVAITSGRFALKSARDVEQMRHVSESMERLRGATGTLRLELFLSTRSVARRMRLYYDGRPDHPYPVRAVQSGAPESHYHDGGLLIYRTLRPLAVSYIVEQQTFYADLLLEPAMVDLLRFNHASFEMLTGDQLGDERADNDRAPSFDPVPGFSMSRCWDADLGWPLQRQPSESAYLFQRVRASYLRSAAAALVVSERGRTPRRRCMMHAEFLDAWTHPGRHEDFHAALAPVKAVIDRFDPRSNVVFWVRLVGYAYVCRWFHDQVRQAASRMADRHADVDYAPVELPVTDMLMKAASRPPDDSCLTSAQVDETAAQKRHLAEHASEYESRYEAILRGAF